MQIVLATKCLVSIGSAVIPTLATLEQQRSEFSLFKNDINRMAARVALLEFFLATICIYSCDAIANEINQNDLNQDEESYNDDLVNAIFHSNFWTSREMKVMTKYISHCQCLLWDLRKIFKD